MKLRKQKPEYANRFIKESFGHPSLNFLLRYDIAFRTVVAVRDKVGVDNLIHHEAFARSVDYIS